MFKDISKVFGNLQSQLVINQKFEKDIFFSICHCQQRIQYEVSLYLEAAIGGAL